MREKWRQHLAKRSRLKPISLSGQYQFLSNLSSQVIFQPRALTVQGPHFVLNFRPTVWLQQQRKKAHRKLVQEPHVGNAQVLSGSCLLQIGFVVNVNQKSLCNLHSWFTRLFPHLGLFRLTIFLSILFSGRKQKENQDINWIQAGWIKTRLRIALENFG